MPLPLIIGAAALVAASYGAKKGYDGYQKHSEADDIVKRAKAAYDERRTVFDAQEKKTEVALTALGNLELEIGESFGEFKTLADTLINDLNANSQDKLEVKFPKRELQKIENYSYSAVGVLGSIAGAGAAGAAAGFAVYGGVMALGAASTGTAISALAGAAATNATLAAIGGGSLAAGGLGMAGGTAILGAAVAAPILAIAGWAYDNHGEEALKNAHKASDEADAAIKKLGKADEFLADTEEYARRIKRALTRIYREFHCYFDDLKDVSALVDDLKGRNVDVAAELAKLGTSVTQIIENGYALASILTKVITTPLFKVKEARGAILVDENGLPEMLKDADGSMMLNGDKIDDVLDAAKQDATRYEHR
ncbi:chemotaxis protein [Achromobacter kerstersii]|uniref:chemotaxis protein n=1 Tax=Achromobacter kerstersii TaxID=1353890 RepID=UPI003209FE42